MNAQTAVNKWKWLKTQQLQSEKSQSHLLCMVTRWLRFFLTSPLGKVAAAEVKAYEDQLEEGGMSNAALNRERLFVRQFFRWAREHGWIDHDPSAGWGYRNEKVEREYAPLSRDAEGLLLYAAPTWLEHYIVFSICTGLRQGTIRQLTWRHVKPMPGGEWFLEVPARLMKARRPLRMPLSGAACGALACGHPGSTQPLVKLPSEPTKIYREFKKAVAKAGINPATTPHDLRRTWVQRMNEAGATLQQTMALGGWSSPGTLLKHYFTPVQDDVARALLEKI